MARPVAQSKATNVRPAAKSAALANVGAARSIRNAVEALLRLAPAEESGAVGRGA